MRLGTTVLFVMLSRRFSALRVLYHHRGDRMASVLFAIPPPPFVQPSSLGGAAPFSSSPSSPDKLVRPRDVVVPLDRIEFAFARSSGPGGQNVNKLNTKAEIRFHVMSADWLPLQVRERLQQYQANKISKEGELIITCQEHRTQSKNKDDCIEKLKEMVAEAFVEPKDRQMWEGISDKGKEQRRDEKRKRGAVKSTRRISKDEWD